MSSSLRSIPALLGIFFAVPLTAQAPALKGAATVATATTFAPVKADTAVTWILLRSNHGELHGKLRQVVKAEIAKAKARNLTPFFMIGAEWCGPCKALEARLHDKDMIDAFSGAYMMRIDVNEWDIKEELSYSFIDGHIPMMLTLDEHGKVTGEYHGFDGPESIKTILRPHFWKNPVRKLAAK